jgi:sulfate permease, SulP family
VQEHDIAGPASGPSRLQTIFQKARNTLYRETRPAHLIPSLFGGVLIGLLVSVFVSSFATLIFSGTLSAYLPQGIGVGLLSVAVVSVILAVFSTYRGHVSNLISSSVLVFSLITQTIVAGIPAGTPGDEVFWLTVLGLGTCTVGVGVFLFALGHFKLGGLIRYIPYPVIGGLLAGTGWLLVRGGLQTMTGLNLTLDTWPALFGSSVLLLWIPGVALSLVMVVVQERAKHYLVFPALVLAAVLVFHGIALAMGVSMAELETQGWVLQSSMQSLPGWSLPHYSGLLHFPWSSFFGQGTNLVTLLAIQVIGMLLYLSALELEGRQDIDFNHELKWTGISNLLVGLGGGIAGAVSMSSSSMARKMGAATRLTGVVAGLVCLVAIYFGALFYYTPKFLFGALLTTAGFTLLKEWLVDARTKLPWQDYGVIVLILFVMSFAGFIQGVTTGVTVGLILFVINYSRINVVKNVLSGRDFRSNVDRSINERNNLSLHGDQILIMRLQGFIFFGTAVQLVDQLNRRLKDPEATPLRYLILDFRSVTGVDSSSVNSFIKLAQYAEQSDFDLVLSGLSPRISLQMAKGGVPQRRVHAYADLQRALKWCEDQLLLNSRRVPTARINLPERLTTVLGDAAMAERVIPFLERLELQENEEFIHEGDPSSDLYFIEQGRLRVELRHPGSHPILVRTLGAGSFVGEVAYYLRIPRSASVVADQKAVVFRISGTALDTMRREQPALSSALHAFMAGMLARRLADTDRLLQQVID